MAGRPGLAIGGHGRITSEKLPDGRWRAKARYRGDDGVVRTIQRETPVGVKDPRGVQAEKALEAPITELVGDVSDGEVSGGSKLRDLGERYLVELAKSDKAVRTKDSYSRDVGLLLPRLGDTECGRRLPRGSARSSTRSRLLMGSQPRNGAERF